ncbi:MAG: hypothetical protein R3E79_58120 [Caldilineaceae bacterium]
MQYEREFVGFHITWKRLSRQPSAEGVRPKKVRVGQCPGTSDNRFYIRNYCLLVPGTFAPNFGCTRRGQQGLAATAVAYLFILRYNQQSSPVP